MDKTKKGYEKIGLTLETHMAIEFYNPSLVKPATATKEYLLLLLNQIKVLPHRSK